MKTKLSTSTSSLRHIATKATLSVTLASLMGCTAAQQQQLADNPFFPAATAVVGEIIGQKAGLGKGTGAALGGIIGIAIQQQIRATQLQQERAISNARYAYNRDASFKQKYTSAKRDKGVKYVAVKVPKDENDPNSKAGFMLYDPSRGSLNSNTVYVSNSHASNGSVADIDGKRAMIYSGAM